MSWRDEVERVLAGDDPVATDQDDPAYDDSAEGANRRRRPVTSLGGSELLSATWQDRRP